MSFLTSLTDDQLVRLQSRLYGRITKDRFGADWRTLQINNPGLFNSYRTVMNEMAYRGFFMEG